MGKYEKYKYKASLFKESTQVLEQIASLGIPQSIISASQNVLLNDMVNHYKIKHYFEQVGGLTHFFATSKIELASKLCAEIQCNNKNILFVGDTLHDFEIASILNAQSILFSKGHCSIKRLKTTNGKIINSLTKIMDWIY